MDFNVDGILNRIANNKGIKRIFDRVSSPNYSKLSFQEKKRIYNEFNDILNSLFSSNLGFHINKNAKKSPNGDVKLSVDKDLIIVDGINGNPYIYLKDILIQHLYIINKDDSINIQMGDIAFEEDYLSSGFKFIYYSKNNIWIIKKAVRVIDDLLKNIDNNYKKEYKKDFDKVITKGAQEEIATCYDIFDKEIRLDSYEALCKIGNIIDKNILGNSEPKKEDLALLSLKAPLSVLQIQSTLDNKELEKCNKLLRKFVETFFPEYSKEINIKIKDCEIYVNNVIVRENQMFMDVVLQTIEAIEKRYPRLNDLITDETLKRFAGETSKCSKLDLFFIKKLDELDSCLKGRELEWINYIPWTKIYKDSKKRIFKDKSDIFEKLLEREDFIKEVDNYLSGKCKSEKESLSKIFSMLNEAYFNSDFKLSFNDTITGDSFLGNAGEKEIIINITNSVNKENTLATLFHEYRHLVQEAEAENNHGVFNDIVYSKIKYNNRLSAFDLSYSYCEDVDYGYVNSFHYYMQPSEYDAENFSYWFFRQIATKLGIKINYSNCFPSLIKSKFIDQEKISLLSYDDYLRMNTIEESYIEDQKEYEELMELYNQMDSKEDAIKVFSYKRFAYLKTKDKIRVYQYLSNVKLGYNDETRTLYLGKKAIKLEGLTDYDVLEKILYIEAIEKVKNNELKVSEIDDYIYLESKKYKQDKFDINNFLSSYYYHKCFDKYAHGRDKLLVSGKNRP